MCFGLFSKCLDGDDANAPAPKPHHQPPSSAFSSQAPQIPMSTKPRADPQTIEVTQGAINTFFASRTDNGEIGGIGWWQVANGYSAVSLHDFYTHSEHNRSAVSEQLARCGKRQANFINEFNDDSLWFGHALLDLQQAYPTTDFRPSLDPIPIAHAVWAHVCRSQLPGPGKHVLADGADMHGAILWTSKPDEDGANAIASSLFAELAARLALTIAATPNDPDRRQSHPYLNSTERAVAWILREVYRRDDDIILDGIAMRKNDRCGWTFTYTTGQTIAALALFATALRQIPSYGKAADAESYMRTACRLARASFRRSNWTDSDGILTEHKKGEQDPWKNNDGWGFEAVLVRAMAKLYLVLTGGGWVQQDREFEETAEGIRQFVETQYKALRERNCSEGGKGSQYGPWWEGPFEAPTSHSQLAVLDVMGAIHAVRD